MKKQITCAATVITHETGYDKYTVSGVWNCSIWKTVPSHTSLRPQAPSSDTIIGVIEYPIPRREPTITSIMPHRKYVPQTYIILRRPALIEASPEV